MNKLLIMIVICIVLAIISQRKSESLSKNGKEEQENLFFFLLSTYMVIFAGLRTYFNDTYAYIVAFNNASSFPACFQNMNWTLGANPGFSIFISIVKTFTKNYHIYIMLSAAATLYPTIWFIRKYTRNFALSIFFMFMLGYFTFSMAAMKQTMATAIALIAVEQLLRSRKLLFVCLMLLAMTFHPYCLLYFLAPLLLKQIPWRKGTWIVILCSLIAAYSFNFLMGTILEITDIIGDEYDADAFIGEGVNIFRVLVYFTPVVLSYLWRKSLFENSSKTDNLFVNLSIVCAMIMFVGLFGNANMFGRLGKFFDPIVFISLSWVLYKLKGGLSGMVLAFGAYVAAPAFFYYDMYINSSFDQAFISITIGQFFRSLFP